MGTGGRGGHAVRIAIADDHDVVRDGIRWLLADRADIDIVAEAETSQRAIEIILSDDRPDVLLLDLRMGGTSGFDVLQAADQAGSATRIVVLSMHDDTAHVRRAMRLGAAGYILKNSSRTELFRAIETAASGQRYIQGDLAGTLVEEAEATTSVSPREREILELMADGAENKQVARQLGISEDTVKSYLKALFARWEVSSRAEAVALAIRMGVID